MGKKIILTIVILCTYTAIGKAQDAIVFEDTLSGWNYSWGAGLNGSQASYSNWAKGGVNTVSLTGRSSFVAKHKKNRFAYGLLFSSRFGKTKIEDEGTRKTDDLLLIRNKFLYDLNDTGSLKLFSNINLNTQYDNGFDYDAGPEGEDILISKFFAPAYLTENAGLAYVPADYFNLEFGAGFKQTIVTEASLAPLYGLDPGDKTLFEGGLNVGINFEYTLAENVTYSTSVETFTNVKREISSTDLYFYNQIIGKINNFLNASLQVDLVFDDDFSEEIQTAQVLALGITVNIL